MSFQDNRPPTRIGFLHGHRLPSNDPNAASTNATASQTIQYPSTSQNDAAANRQQKRRDAGVVGKGRNAASGKAAPRKADVHRDRPKPQPPVKKGLSTQDANVAKAARKRRISDVEGAQYGPRAERSDGKDTAVKRQGVSRDPRFVVKKESPWQTYDEGYNLRVGGQVTVALRKRSESPAVVANLVAIREFCGPSREAELSTLCQVQGKNFVEFIVAYLMEDVLYVVLELMPISLVQIVAATVQPREVHVSAILAQVVSGVQFLESRGLVHGAIDCSTVLLNNQGEVKIGMQERCTAVSGVDHRHTDTEAIADIMMQLLEKRSKGEDSADAAALQRWSTTAKDFYINIKSQSAGQLSQHTFLGDWNKNDLLILVSLAQVSSRRFYSVGC